MAVTEGEWLGCTDPAAMLNFIQDRASDRKLRLFAVACCHRIWDSISEWCCRQAVTVSERYADNRASYEQLEAAFMAAEWTCNRVRPEGLQTSHALDAARLAAHPETRGLADGTATAAAMAGAGSREDFWQRYAKEQAHLCILLRDIFGNPFRPVTLVPAVLSWNAATVVRLAQAAYDERHLPAGTLDTGRLAVLADALEEAGCTLRAILDGALAAFGEDEGEV
jgi:hypothetical protein